MSDSERELTITGTLDIECADWTRFLCAATYEPSQGTKHHDSIDALVTYLRSRGGTWWAHCGGQYDFLAIAELLRRQGKSAQIDYSRSRIGRLVTKGFQLRDSFGLVPMGLDKAAPIASMQAPTLPWACTCFPVRECGGYCYLSSALKPDELQTLRDYCAADCYVLYQVLQTLVEFARAARLTLRGTIGSTAWATAQRELGLPDVDYPMQTWERIGKASYGGRDLIIRPTVKAQCTHYDVSSAYGAALARSPVPVGDTRELGGRRAGLALENLAPGVYEAAVYIPEDTFLPLLPVRCGGRVVYPVGLVEGAWTLPELLAAVERGAEIQQLGTAVVWESEEVLFDDLIGHWYKLRRSVGKRSALGEWVRLLVNSLTGKFSENPTRMTVRMHPEEIRVCERKGRCRQGCTKRCGAFVPIDAWGQLWGQPFFRLGNNSHMQWAAYLRAYARLQLAEGIERSGPESHCYSKTDSIWTTSRVAPGRVGQTLGAWEHQGSYDELDVRAPGTYAAKRSDGTWQIHAAGAGKVSIEEWRAGRVRRKDGARALLQAAQHGRTLFERQDFTYTLPTKTSSWYGDRLLGDRGLTYPQPLEIHHGRQARRARPE